MKTLVVGMDGSADALAALDWATEVVDPNGTIHVVHAISPAEDIVVAAAQVVSEPARRRAQRLLDDAWLVPARTRGVPVVGEVVEDSPADALLQAAQDHDADGVVIGVHGRSLIVPRAIGTITSHLLHRVRRPLVIVRRDRAKPLVAGETVVVGVGRGEATRAALHWAVQLASARGLALSLVHATGTRPLFDEDGLLEVIAYYIDPSKVREWAVGGPRRTRRASSNARADEPAPRVVDRAVGPARASSGRGGGRCHAARHRAATTTVHYRPFHRPGAPPRRDPRALPGGRSCPTATPWRG